MKEYKLIDSERKEGKVIINPYGRELKYLEEVVQELNNLEQSIQIHMSNNKKLKELLYEKISPSYGDDVYLDIDSETKRCKYEHTHICHDFQCEYFSNYFLDCRLMMEDKQFQRAKELKLI